MVDFGAYNDKFAESGLRVLVYAIDEARHRKQNYVSPGHILKALTVEVPSSLDAFRQSWSALHESLAAHVSAGHRPQFAITSGISSSSAY